MEVNCRPALCDRAGVSYITSRHHHPDFAIVIIASSSSFRKKFKNAYRFVTQVKEGVDITV